MCTKKSGTADFITTGVSQSESMWKAGSNIWRDDVGAHKKKIEETANYSTSYGLDKYKIKKKHTILDRKWSTSQELNKPTDHDHDHENYSQDVSSYVSTLK